MGQNQSEQIIEALNEQQDIYYIKRQLTHLSKSPCFKGYKKRKEGNNDESSKHKHKQKPYDETKSFFLKLVPYDTEIEVKYFDREQKIINLFSDDPEILKNEKVVDIPLKDKRYVMVPTTYYHLNDAFEYLSKNFNEINEKVIRSISFQGVKILKLLKTQKVVHNNIKFENFIVQSDSPVKISLTDFKMAQILNENEKSNNLTGTTVYKAPEILKKMGHDYPADMWSLGANIYLSFLKMFPFGIKRSDDESEILNKIENNKLTNEGNVIPDDAWDCISKMLVKDPNERITPDDALNLKWFDAEMNPPSVAPASNEIHLNTGEDDDDE